jgi:hypothetical protein
MKFVLEIVSEETHEKHHHSWEHKWYIPFKFYSENGNQESLKTPEEIRMAVIGVILTL